MRVFAPNATATELDKVARRGNIHFVAEAEGSESFRLAKSALEVEREGLVIKLPARPLSGTRGLLADSFCIWFARGEELKGCRRFFLLICHRVVGVEVTRTRVHVEMPTHLLEQVR